MNALEEKELKDQLELKAATHGHVFIGTEWKTLPNKSRELSCTNQGCSARTSFTRYGTILGTAHEEDCVKPIPETTTGHVLFPVAGEDQNK